MELLPVSNTTTFFTKTAEHYTAFMKFLDEGDPLYIDNEKNIVRQAGGNDHYLIYADILGDEVTNYSRAIPPRIMPLEIHEDSDSTTLVLSLQVVSPGINNVGTQVNHTKVDPKYSRYIMPIELPENAGIMLGNTNVTMEEGTWYEYPVEKSQRTYNNNEDGEDMVILVHDVVKTKHANTSVIKSYLEDVNRNVSQFQTDMIDKIDNGELEDNYQRSPKFGEWAEDY